MKYIARQLFCLGVFLQLCLADGPSNCSPIDAVARKKLISYVQKKFSWPANTVEVREMEFVRGTCYRKLEFIARGARPFRVELIASPDLRFLTRELLDSQADLDEEERRLAIDLANGSFPSIGPKDAAVTLVLFSDFQCPYCKQLATALLNEILPSEGNDVRLIFRNFPLPTHVWARPAAEAAACAWAQGDKYFWALHDYIFASQGEFTIDNVLSRLLRRAETITELDLARFKTCLDNEASAEHVNQDIAAGRKVRIEATPTLFVDGQRVAGYDPDQIRAIIREHLHPARPQK